MVDADYKVISNQSIVVLVGFTECVYAECGFEASYEMNGPTGRLDDWLYETLGVL